MQKRNIKTRGELERAGTGMAAGAVLSLISAGAHASGFALLEQSASRLGTAFAGTAAAADDASTLFYNPAGLLNLEQAEVSIVASGVLINSEFNDENSLPAFGQTLGNSGGDAGDWNAIPSVYFALPVNDDLALGFSFNVPFGLKLEYDDEWIGRYQALKSEIRTYNFSPALAFRLTDHVTLGFGMNYQRVLAELTNDVNYSAVVAEGVGRLVAAGQVPPALAPSLIGANAGLSGGAVVRGDDSAWGFNAGVLFEFSEQTRLGLSYRSPLRYRIEGSVNFSPPTASDPVGQQIIAAASAPGQLLADTAATLNIELPDIATASFYQRLGSKVELLIDVAWTGWSSVQELRIERANGQPPLVTPELWDDTWRYAAGLAFEVSPALKLRAGIAFDETPVPDATRTPRLPDPEREWVALGARWSPSEAIVMDVGYAHLFSDDAPLDQDGGSVAQYGLLNGHQDSAVDIVSVQFGYRF